MTSLSLTGARVSLTISVAGTLVLGSLMICVGLIAYKHRYRPATRLATTVGTAGRYHGIQKTENGAVSLRLEPIQEMTQRLIRSAVGPGTRALDGTAGNGHDTRFLAECVGTTGKVVGFDIQHEAIHQTRTRLTDAGVQERVQLVQASHEHLGGWLDTHWPGDRLAGAMFNLGYRPGGDHATITRAQSTLAALDQTVTRLQPGGMLTVVLYTGHQGGHDEAAAVVNWARNLDPSLGLVLWYQFLNRANPPSLLAFCKSGPAAPAAAPGTP